MISKLSRPAIFLYSFIFTLLLLFVTLFTYFFASGKKNWISEVIEVRLFLMPLLFYLVIISLIVAFLILLLVYFVHRTQYGKIEQKINLLTLGNYESPLLFSETKHSRGDQYISAIDQNIFFCVIN